MTTVKEALVHLAIVTAGIVIALSLDGVREWRAHGVLVAEARQNLTAELRDNQKEIAGYLAAAPKTQQQLETAYELADGLLHGRKPGSLSLTLEYHRAELRTASRATADTTGAFAFMPYGEVGRYARAYDRQALFERDQDRAINTFADAFAGVRLLQGPSAERFFGRTPIADHDADELRAWKQTLAMAKSAQTVAHQVASALNDEYTRTLAGQ